MTYSVLLFLKRKPSLTSDQFRDYYENRHVPLLTQLVGPKLFPLRFTRNYLARTNRAGFGGPANKDHPILMLRGMPETFDYDVLGEMVWEDEKTFAAFYKAIYETDAAAKIAQDEERFLESGSLKAIIVGQTTESRREHVPPH